MITNKEMPAVIELYEVCDSRKGEDVDAAKTAMESCNVFQVRTDIGESVLYVAAKRAHVNIIYLLNSVYPELVEEPDEKGFTQRHFVDGEMLCVRCWSLVHMLTRLAESINVLLCIW